MINILHLLWIVPLSAVFGFIVAILLSNNKTYDRGKNNEH